MAISRNTVYFYDLTCILGKKINNSFTVNCNYTVVNALEV